MSRKMPRIKIRSLSAGYTAHTSVVHEFSATIDAEKLTIIVGPNSSGKSTLLKAIADRVRIHGGSVAIDGVTTERIKPKDLANTVAYLPQYPQAPDGMKVSDLIASARSPHTSFFIPFTPADERIITHALNVTGAGAYAGRDLDELAGHQAQRVWVAAAIARNTGIVLLDEPARHLDPSRTIELYNLCHRLTRDEHKTIVIATNDIATALRYADQLIVIDQGRLYLAGKPENIISEELLTDVFHLNATIIQDPHTHGPLIVHGAPPHVKARLAKQPKKSESATPIDDARAREEAAQRALQALQEAEAAQEAERAIQIAHDAEEQARAKQAEVDDIHARAKKADTKARQLRAKAHKYEAEIDELDPSDEEYEKLRDRAVKAAAEATAAENKAALLKEELSSSKQARTEAEVDAQQAREEALKAQATMLDGDQESEPSSQQS